MLERMEEQKRCINLFCSENTAVTALTKKQWDLISNVIDLLRPFKELTRNISSTESIISDVIPAVTSLKVYLKKIKQ